MVSNRSDLKLQHCIHNDDGVANHWRIAAAVVIIIDAFLIGLLGCEVLLHNF